MKISEVVSKAKEQYKIDNMLTCKKCGYTWTRRKDNPITCPNCKCKNWK